MEEAYIKQIKAKFPLKKVKAILDQLEGINVLLVGDAIIDEYYFTVPKGRAIKDPIMSVDYIHHERYLGGTLAIANHISNFVRNVNLVTLLGDRDSEEKFIKEFLNKNVDTKFFIKKDSPTIIKRRFIDQVRNIKLFKVEFMNDAPINKELEKDLVAYLKEEIPKHDLLVVADFDHGFINNKIARTLEKYSKNLHLNVQTNSSNYGFNLITKYKYADFTSMDENELKLTMGSRFEDIDFLVKKLADKKLINKILVTLGNKGCVYTANGEKLLKAPILTKSVVDTVGAGDAVFSIISLLISVDTDNELIPFVSNCVGGIAVNILGNKESVTKEKLIEFIEECYNKV